MDLKILGDESMLGGCRKQVKLLEFLCRVNWICVPSGKHLHNYGEYWRITMLLMGKSTIYKWQFSIAILVIPGGYVMCSDVMISS